MTGDDKTVPQSSSPQTWDEARKLAVEITDPILLSTGESAGLMGLLRNPPAPSEAVLDRFRRHGGRSTR